VHQSTDPEGSTAPDQSDTDRPIQVHSTVPAGTEDIRSEFWYFRDQTEGSHEPKNALLRAS
jgi:hypothetical protein